MIQSFLKEQIPPSLWRFAKKHAAEIRYLYRQSLCSRSYNQYADHYPQKILFIAGLPKSGTTWLENMIGSYPGIHNLLIPEATIDELKNKGSHHFNLPEDFASRFAGMILLTKMHIPGSVHNANLLHKANIPYVVLHRDLRDVALSYYFYVHRTPWHPEYKDYRFLDVTAGLRYFAEHTLGDFAEWVRLWKQNRDTGNSLMFTYEDMIADTKECLSQVACLFQLDNHPEILQQIINVNSFVKLSGGRKPGQANSRSFFRSGTSGGWKTAFSEEIKAVFKRKIGDYLIEFGYEKDCSW